jgi:SH3-like domain-containing protein
MRIFATLLLLIILSGCREKSIPVSLKSDIDSIILKWVPDKREGICSVEMVKLPGDIIKLNGETDIPRVGMEIVKFLERSGFKCQDSIFILPDTSVIKKKWGLVSVSVCNIKKDPSYASEFTSQAMMGTPVKILKRRGSWMLVQTPDYYLGWVNRSSLSELDDDEIAKWKQSDRIIYTSKSGDIVSVNNTEDVVSDIVAGVILQVKNKQAERYDVVLPDGREGNIPEKNAVDFKKWCLETVPEASKMISMAKSLKGSPYMWGGTSTKGVDCSGFTKILYFSGGVILARDASLQFLHGESLEVSDDFKSLLPGDLIFFGHLNDLGEKRITHVGMYIGDTEVIHSSGMVRINSLDTTRVNYSSYLKESLMGARRIIGAPDIRGTQSVKTNPWYFLK